MHATSFREWFERSKVVDASGMPLVVYHGTREDFEHFDPRAIGLASRSPTAKLGFYFSEDPTIAGSFAVQRETSGARTLPVYLRIQNPKVLTAKQFTEGSWSDLAGWQRLASQGYDGVHLLRDPSIAARPGGAEYGADTWIAFRSEQIRSAIAAGIEPRAVWQP